jgi:hypothetical protein
MRAARRNGNRRAYRGARLLRLARRVRSLRFTVPLRGLRDSVMSADNPRVRASLVCPLCNGAKASGLVACWPCFRTSGLKEGAAAPEALVAARERWLAKLGLAGANEGGRQERSGASAERVEVKPYLWRGTLNGV